MRTNTHTYTHIRTHTRLQTQTPANTHRRAHARTYAHAQTHIASDGLQQLFSVAVDAPTLVVVNLLVTNQQTEIEVRMCL